MSTRLLPGNDVETWKTGQIELILQREIDILHSRRYERLQRKPQCSCTKLSNIISWLVYRGEDDDGDDDDGGGGGGGGDDDDDDDDSLCLNGNFH